jgi:RNA polymerase sigma-70 factor (ECF subfamily)
MIALLTRELMTMPRDQREIILLRDYHDLSYAEVARVLSIPVGTVMSRLHRARSELRRRMHKYR